MEVGIITFIDTINYGASLQAYALQECIESFGVSAEIIQYTNETIKKKENNTGKISARRILKSITMGSAIKRKVKAFHEYELKNLHRGLAITDNNYDEIEDRYNLFITGSDQVWNMEITNCDWTYFLDFVKDNKKKVSYAPSFGNKSLSQSCYESASFYINQINALSVREESGQKLIKKLTGRDATVVVDPTLLLDKDEWEENTTYIPKLEHYILVYFPHNKSLVFEFVSKLQKKTGLPVVYLSISPRQQRGVKTIYDASPEEFLGWMKYADYIVTGSFHGTAFSLNLEKQFYYEPSGEGSRIDNIVKLTGTGNRRIDNANVLDTVIDYDIVSEILSIERQKSKDWLKNALGV